MCGVAGLVGKSPVNQALYDVLIALQHRGQDAAGIVTCDAGRFFLRKSTGLVRDVFHTRHMLRLKGNMGIGHVRYPTAGGACQSEAQPFYVNSPYGITLAHNGNLTNTHALKQELFATDRRHLNTNSDSEMLLNIFANGLLKKVAHAELTPSAIFAAVKEVHERCKGAYAVVLMIAGYGVVAFRDPFGIRPLVYGSRTTPSGEEYLVASESVALDLSGFNYTADIAPGEAIIITEKGEVHVAQCAENPTANLCIFELVYLARPDSVIDGISVHKMRLRLGEKLAAKIQREWAQHDIDVVMPIPDTSRPAALTLAHQLGLKYREGFVKNRYIGRTFIMPGQKERRKSVRQKLNAIPLEFKGKNILLVDDSIVRGTTSREIVQIARDAGANKVYFASAAPPVRFPNVYGIDMPAASELVAHDKNVEEICKLIGADKLIYQDLEDLLDSPLGGSSPVTHFDASVFDGIYVTGDISADYLAELENTRCDSAKQAKRASQMIDLHNGE